MRDVSRHTAFVGLAVVLLLGIAFFFGRRVGATVQPGLVVLGGLGAVGVLLAYRLGRSATAASGEWPRAEELCRDPQLDELAETVRQLEQSNQELEQFAHICSHDLQEPLRKIQVFSEKLQERNQDTLDDHSRYYLGRIVDAATRMRALVDDLRKLTRVGAEPSKPQEVDLDRLCAQVISDLEPKLLQLNAQIQADELGTVHGNAVQIRQVLQNIIDNGLKFRRPDATPLITIGATRSENQIEIRIADNGIGFDPSQADHIFDVFQRLHNREDFDGTGIGLAICRKIVARHSGTIRAESTPKKGSTFIITLPTLG